MASACARRIEAGEVAQYLLFAAWDQRHPILHGLRIPGERSLERFRHGMLRPISVAGVEIDVHAHAIAHCCTGCLSNITVQVQVEASVACRHHVDAPGISGLAVDANENRKWFAPARLDGLRPRRAYEDEGVDTSNMDNRAEARFHGSLGPASNVAS